MVTSMMHDLRYAVRQLRKAPAFTLTAVLTLALGIGATAAMYSVVRDVLLAPLPYPEQERLVGLTFTYSHKKLNNSETGANAAFLAEHAKSFAAIGVSDRSTNGESLSAGLGDGAHAFQIVGMHVNQGYFPTLRIRPELGRAFTAEEDLPNGPKAVLLGDALWRRAFHADPKILDSVIRINEEPYTVVGVMPPSLMGASGGPEAEQASETDVWTPLQLGPKTPGFNGNNFQGIARLKPGVSLVQAQQELDGLDEPFYQEHPDYRLWEKRVGSPLKFQAWPLQQVIVSNARASLLTMLAAVIAVLLVACLNLGVLMTARASQRSREIALRTALGATRGSVLRLMMVESLLLALVGGGLGLILARVAAPVLLAASPIAIPQLQRGSGIPVLFTLAVACVATVLFGLLPALGVFRQDANRVLQVGTMGGSVSQVRTGRVLMVGQVAVAMVLLSTASLLLGSFLKLRAIPSGVVAKRLTVAQVTLKGAPYASTHHTTQFIEKVMTGLEHYPGVERVAVVNGLPLDHGLNNGGHPVEQPDLRENVEFRAITPGYFRTLGVALLQGRDIAETDRADAAPVAIISEEAARQWWPGRSPIGHQVVMGGKGEIPKTVIGVAANTRANSLAEELQVMIYAPFAQLADGDMKMINGWFPTTFALRTAGDVDLAAAIQQAVSAADPDIPVAKIETMQAVIDHTVAGPAFFSWIAGGFAGFALLLTIIGLFGLLSYQVTQRTREIGVRLALGAQRRQVLGFILRRGLALTAVGLAIGSIASMAIPRVVGSVLADYVYTGGGAITQVLSSTTAALMAAALAMLLATLAASYLPARRAARIEPMEALRTE